MKPKVSVVLVAAALFLGSVVCAQALSFTEALTLSNDAKYEVSIDKEGNQITEFKFNASANLDSLSLPANWLIDVELFNGVYEKSDVYGIDNMQIVDATDKKASKIVKKKIKKDAGYMEGHFDPFVLSIDDDPSGLIQFYGALPGITVIEVKEKYAGSIYIYGSFRDGENESVLDFQGYISNLDPGPPSSAPVPEPATMVLMGAGMLGLAAIRRQRMR